MDAAAGRGGSLPVPSSSSQPPRKEWRAAPDHSFRNGKEDSEHVKLGQPDERTIFKEGVGSLDVDFCSIRIDSGNDGPLQLQQQQQQLHHISMQRQELQRMEIELRAQVIAKSEILDVQNNYEVQLNEQSSIAAKLKEKLRESEERIRELELQIEEKDRELHSVNSEAAWAKEDFLREQSEKLANFRRERDSLEAERAQQLKQIHDLQGHSKDKESQFLALEEQHRAAQDTILFKDGQLKDAQAWIARLQEMGALQQAELREHVDQFHQYYMSLQRQFMDMERHHLQAIQQLQLELTEAREYNGVTSDGLQSASRSSLKSSFYVQSQGNQNNATNDSGPSDGNPKLTPNGKLDNIPSSISSSNTSTKAEYIPAIPVVSSSIIRMGGFLPPGQVNPLPPFVMHPQSVPQPASTNSASLPPHNMDTFQATVAHQHLQNQQAVPDALPIPNQSEHQMFQSTQNVLESGAHYSRQLPVERGKVHEDHLNTHSDQTQMSDATTNGSSLEIQVLEPDAKQCQVSQGSQDTSMINSQLHSTFVDPSEQQTKLEYKNKSPPVRQPQEQGFNSSQQQSISSVAGSTAPNSSATSNSSAECKDNLMASPANSVLISRPTSSTNSVRAMEPSLLDERSLLACIVRAIPAGSGNGIKMSTTLPNRLGKMLAPLHWHDYKKQYGKLDDFVARHPELFVIEGDFIHLREGAQEIISATAAVAKVAAATASASTPYSVQFPSVAVTPVAQISRLKRTPLTDSKPLTTIPTVESSISLRNSGDSFHTMRGISDGKALSKTKDPHVSDVSCGRTGPSPAQAVVGNGVNLERPLVPPLQNKVLSDGRHDVGGRRSVGAGSISRR